MWTAGQAAVFLAATRHDRLAGAWALAVAGGLRRGEMCGMRWSAVDLGGAMLAVHEQRTPVNGGGLHIGAPKVGSWRSVPLGPALVGILTARREAWEVERKRARGGGGAARKTHTCSGRCRGPPYHPAYFTRRWAGACRAAGVPMIALHDARHTSATVAATAGVDISTLQARLGHSDAKILTRVYLHLVTEAARGAASTVEDALGM